MDKIRALIVDDEPLAREGMRLHLGEHPEIEVIGECDDGATAVMMIRDVKPDLVFLDVQMSGLDGFGVLRAIGTEHMPIVVFVTAYDQFALQAFEAHAIDFNVPTAPGKIYQAYASLGTAGIPLSSFLSPSDPRILPLSNDLILNWGLLANPSWFANFGGQLNGVGYNRGFFGVPPNPALLGVTFHFAFIVWDPQAQSGVGHVSPSASMTIN